METALIALTEAGLRELAEQEFDSGSAELVPRPFGTIDTTALNIAHRLRADLREGGSELYADTLITLFGIHLLRNKSEPSIMLRRMWRIHTNSRFAAPTVVIAAIR